MILLSHLTLTVFPLISVAHKTGGTVVVDMVLMIILIILRVVLLT